MAVAPQDLLFTRQLERKLREANSNEAAELIINKRIDILVGRSAIYRSKLAGSGRALHEGNFKAMGPAYLTHFKFDITDSSENVFKKIWESLKAQKNSSLKGSTATPISSDDILAQIRALESETARTSTLNEYNALLNDKINNYLEVADASATELSLLEGRSAYNLMMDTLSEDKKNIHIGNLKALGEQYYLAFKFQNATEHNPNPFINIWTKLSNLKDTPLSKEFPQGTILGDTEIRAQIASVEDKKQRKQVEADYNALIQESRDAIVKRAEEEHESNLDRVALGLDPKSAIPENAFQTIWNQLKTDKKLTNPTGKEVHDFPRHHTELLEWIKSNFDAEKQVKLSPLEWALRKVTKSKDTSSLYDRYYDARNAYYAILKQEHEKNQKWKDLPERKADEQLGDEDLMLDNEIANKKEDQVLLTHGLFWAKVFALAQGFFVGGGTFGLMTAGAFIFGATFMGGLIFVPSIVAGVLFMVSTRSNWLTINEEMGPLLKALFFDPSLAHLSLSKRFMFILRRTDLTDGWNTFKGATNLIAGAFIGILTFVGSIGLMSFIPALNILGKFTAGSFGTGSIAVLAISGVLALVATFVYFVINNINQQLKNKNSDWLKDSLERHEKLRVITDSTLNPFKKYGFNILVAGIGITGLLLGASMDLFGVLSPSFSQTTGSLLTVLHSTLTAMPIIGIVTGLVFMLGLYGISSFYQKRTVNSTEGLIVDANSGLHFDKMRTKFAQRDVTGQDAPDLDTIGHPQFDTKSVGGIIGKGIFDFGTFFFNMDPNRDNSQTARIGNALGQGMPALAGSSAISFVFFKYLQVGLGIGGAGWAMPLVMSLAVGVTVLVSAAWASYSANSAGLRVVKEKVTELEILKRDKAELANAEPKNDHQREQDFLLGQTKAKTELYIKSRERSGEYYWGDGYSKTDKISEAKKMISEIDDYINTDAVSTPLSFSYKGARSQGDLGQIAAQAGMIINKDFAKALDSNGSNLEKVKQRWNALDR